MRAGQPRGYGAADEERAFTEPPKHSWRGPFARDRARVVHSSALRRLSAKTQVVGPGSDDFVRNRLTHSLEVAQVGRELGAQLGCDPDIVETACLAHDLGHPPFGHNGETALDEMAREIGGFEGNAQTLRLLTRLEPKYLDEVTGRPFGLNLTRASLDAATKYPWRRGDGPVPTSKFGVYEDDREIFDWLRSGTAEPHRRCIEAQVMDLADDIAYSVHDVEDAIVAGRLDLRDLDDAGQEARVVQQVQEWYLPDVPADQIHAALARLREMPTWAGDYDGGYRSLAALKNMTSQLIGRFVRAAESATRERYSPGTDAQLTRYAANVVVPIATSYEIGTLKGLAAFYVMTIEERQPVYERQREMLTELVPAIARRAPEELDPVFADAWRSAPDDAGKLRTVIDQVATVTDSRALTWHQKLVASS